MSEVRKRFGTTARTPFTSVPPVVKGIGPRNVRTRRRIGFAGTVLVLFDIDGTLLIRAHVEHRQALGEAVHEVWGATDPGPHAVPAAGRTDGAIARDICLLGAVDAERVDAGMDRFREACARAYARLAPADLRDRHAPHVEGALERVASQPGVRLSLLTGNFEAIARMKIQRAGLVRFFPAGQGGFGSDAEDRTELPAIARRRARGEGCRAPHAPAARPRTRADGVRCLAVTTGPYGADALRGADAVLTGLDE